MDYYRLLKVGLGIAAGAIAGTVLAHIFIL